MRLVDVVKERAPSCSAELAAERLELASLIRELDEISHMLTRLRAERMNGPALNFNLAALAAPIVNALLHHQCSDLFDDRQRAMLEHWESDGFRMDLDRQHDWVKPWIEIVRAERSRLRGQLKAAAGTFVIGYTSTSPSVRSRTGPASRPTCIFTALLQTTGRVVTATIPYVLSHREGPLSRNGAREMRVVTLICRRCPRVPNP